MKKCIAVLLVMAMVLSLAACGGSAEDPNAGVYHGAAAEVSGKALAMKDIYAGETRLELAPRGKGHLKLDGIDFPVKWKLEGEVITLSIHGEKSVGTLKDGIVVIEPLDSGIIMTFLKEGAELPATYQDAGYWDIVRIGSEDPKICVSEEDIFYASTARYLELKPDGTGTLFMGTLLPITWQDGAVTLADERTTHSYTLEDGELALDMTEYTLVFRRGEKPAPRDPSEELAGFGSFMEEGVPYPYVTGTYEKENLATTAETIVTRYDIFESAEGYPAREGYEWRVVEMEARFYDKNANDYGLDASSIFEDYYSAKRCSDESELLEQTDTYVLYRYPILYHGEKRDAYVYWTERLGDWYWVEERGLVECICYTQWNFLVPVGYDGCIAGYMDARLDWADGTYITDYNPDDFLLFRAD